MRLARFSALLAAFGIALFASSGGAAQFAPADEYYCMCYCATTGTTVCLVDDSPDCGVCANACQYAGGGSSES